MGAAAVTALYLKFVSVFSALVAVMMAGSGVNSQSTWGVAQGFHPSMYFMLSLPVSRRYAFLVRSSTGAMFTLLNVLASLAVFGLLGALRGIHFGAGEVLSTTIFISLSSLCFFGLTTLLATLLDEMVAGMLSFGFATGIYGAMIALDWSGKKIQPMHILDGELFLQTGRILWPAVVVLLGFTVVCLLTGAYCVDRRE
jgi:hypothetical protein